MSDMRLYPAQEVAELIDENARLRAELAALREPAGEALVEVARVAFIDAFFASTSDTTGPSETEQREIARAVLAAVLPRVQAEGPTGRKWRHKKRGTTYTEIGRAELQAADAVLEGSELVVYRGDDGKLWARWYAEFEDGRFEPLPPPPEAAP